MENLIERSVSTSTRCYSCGGLVYTVEMKKTTNHIYHNRCFRCRICKRNLTGSSLNEEGDDIYCTNCYRKKQRGDCNSLAFQRAANERAQYVHNGRHPDQPPSPLNLRPPIRHEFSRHPSLTLHKLERQFLSQQEPNTKNFEKSNDNYRQLISVSHPLTIKTSFSAPMNLTNIRRNSSIINDDSSPFLHFSPVFSPYPSNYTNSTATTPRTPAQFNRAKINSEKTTSTINSINGLPFRLNRSHIDLTKSTTPPIERKNSIKIDLNRTNENKNKNESKFRFPDTDITSERRRSSSANYLIRPYKNK